ncbi:MAG: carboxypeptidase regulatory-like domain-containing protein [Bryobacteraceae bacterium]
MGSHFRFTRLCIAALLAVFAASAQVGSDGAILGVVTDPSGSVVVGATVTVTNTGTGLRKTVQTNDAGIFEIPSLPIGAYSVTVTIAGFKSWNLAQTELRVGERKRLAPTLEVGQVSEQVAVEAQVELIQTDKVSVGATIEQKQMTALPLNGRNPISLVRLVPGMRFVSDRSGPERGTSVQGMGSRSDVTEFQVDGLNANAGMDERAITIPNVDTISEFNVETANFSAEHGRNPVQIELVTKSGTNQFHGSLWEFLRNEKLDAFNTYAKRPGAKKPKLSRNQFGGTVGGPIIKDKTHFFFAFEGTTIRQESIYNSTVVQPGMLQGDFTPISAAAVRDPLNGGQPFAGKQIPVSRFSSASQFFFPYLLLPNGPDGRFRSVAPNPNDTYEYVTRIDHQISSKHRIFGRWIIYDNRQKPPDYKPDVYAENKTKQHNVGLTYNYSITPTALLTVTAGYTNSFNRFTSPLVGLDNLTLKAGIRGFPTAGREGSTGLPTVGISGYTGFNAPWGNPGRLWMEAKNAKAALSIIRGKHTVNLGYELNDRTTFGQHASFATRGNFTFNSQYTGDGFADYVLGLTQSGGRNYPLQTFGMKHSPYSGLYVQDFWKITSNFTLNLGARIDYWHEKRAVRGNVGGFDPRIGKALAGVDKNGNVDLTAQPVARFVAKATEGLWVSATDAKVPAGLFVANGYFSPRVGVTWRPLGKNDLVVRGGYGIFPHNGFTGNVTASAIVGPPYWNYENPVYSAASLTRWETAFSDDPTVFLSPAVSAAAFDIKTQKSHEFNISVQKSMPLKSALTLSFVGNRVFDVVGSRDYDAVAPGVYTNLQAARPYPAFGGITLQANQGKSWYNSLQTKWERRFSNGLNFTGVYAWGKYLTDGVQYTPFSPLGYDRGRSGDDRKHILTLSTIYDLPFGRGRKFGANMNPILEKIVGGWEMNGIYGFISGSPLTFSALGAPLGNGYGTRANLVGNPSLSNKSAALWFDPAAFAAPAARVFGSSGIGIMDGPGSHSLDFGLFKNFNIRETKYVQYRWEMFNSTNHVNLGNPGTTIGLSTTGQIFSAGSARTMQMGLKFVF